MGVLPESIDSAEQPAGAVVDLCEVTVLRNGRPILDHLSWRVLPGERWAILGPNGAGKTTAVSVISGRLFPTSGTAQVLGMRLGRVDVRTEIWPRVALASAALDLRFPPGQSVYDVVRTGKFGHLARFRESYDEADEVRAAHLLEQLGISHLADRSLRNVSSGERKRIALARALMAQPEILILDEPTSGLDLGGREQLISIISHIASADTPVPILVTHRVEEIPPNFTHVLLVREGAAFAAGPIGEVLTSQTLTNLFGVPLDVKYDEGRFRAFSQSV